MKEYRIYECYSVKHWEEGIKDKVLIITNDIKEISGALELLNALNDRRGLDDHIWTICEEEEL